MPKLKIPDELLSEFIEMSRESLKLNVVVCGRENAATLLEQFIENNTLLPCPYCSHVEIMPLELGDYFYSMECQQCGANGPNAIDDEDDIGKRWNHRDDTGICPFCKYSGEPEEHYDSKKDKFQCWCPDCEGGGPLADTPEEACELWKKRA